MTSPPAPPSWTIVLPYDKPLSLNSRQHWRSKAREVARVRADVALLARAAKIPRLHRCAIELHYVPRDRGRRDALNLVATLKPTEDGIVDAGIVPDDVARYVEPTMPVLDPPDSTRGTRRLYVIVRELPVPPEHTATHLLEQHGIVAEGSPEHLAAWHDEEHERDAATVAAMGL